MALAAAREIFGPVPCVLEDIEFQKFLVLDQNVALSVQVELDPASSEFDVHVRADASDNTWDVHARGCVRQPARPTPARVDLAQIRQRCPDTFDREECNRRFADCRVSLRPDVPGNGATMAGRTGNAGRDPRPERLERALYPTIDCIPPFSTPVFKQCWRRSRPGPTRRA